MKPSFYRAFLVLLSFALLASLSTGCLSLNKSVAPAMLSLTAPLDGSMIDIDDPKQRSQAAYKIGPSEIDFIYLRYIKELKFEVLTDLSLITSEQNQSTSLEQSKEPLQPGAVIKYPLYNDKGEKNIRLKEFLISN